MKQMSEEQKRAFLNSGIRDPKLERVLRIAFQKAFDSMTLSLHKGIIEEFGRFQDNNIATLDSSKMVNIREEADKILLILKSVMCPCCFEKVEREMIEEVLRSGLPHIVLVVMGLYARAFMALDSTDVAESISTALSEEIYCVLVPRPKTEDMH